jgi:predicted dehydrogenase
MGNIGIGVVGLGTFGERHIQIYSALPNVRLVAVCSRSARRAEEVAGRYGFSRHYDDLERFAADPEIKAVSVTTEPERHAEGVGILLQAGKHVLVEKPVATTMADAESMALMAHSGNTHLMVGHTMRFDIRYATLREQVAAGKFGRLAFVYARRNGAQRLFLHKTRYHPILDASIHDIDLLHWFIQDDVRSVFAVQRNMLEAHRPDSFWAMIQFKSGVVGIIESAMLIADGAPVSFDASMQVTGDAGMGHVRVPEQSVSMWLSSGTESPDLGTWPLLRGSPVGALREELSYFVDCIQSGRPIRHGTPDQAVRALRTAHAIIRSAKEQREITMP